MIKFTLKEQVCKPKIGTEGAGAVDLRIDRDLVLPPGTTATVGTSVNVEIPRDTALLILPRSSSLLQLTNTIGLIDSDYRGEIMAKVRNPTKETIFLHKGDRFLQALLVPVVSTNWELVESLSTTARGDGGFGHTGNK